MYFFIYFFPRLIFCDWFLNIFPCLHSRTACNQAVCDLHHQVLMRTIVLSLHVKENDRLTPLVLVAYGIIFYTKWIGEFFVLSNQFHIKFQIDSNSHEKKHLEHLLPVSTIASWHLYLICTELIKASQNDDLLHALERNIYCISVFSFQSYIHTSLSMFTVAGSAFYFERHSLSNIRFCGFEYTICPSLELCDPCRCLFELLQILRHE